MSSNGDQGFAFEESPVDLAKQIEDQAITCRNCGRALEYSGVGRKPTVCKRGEGCKESEPKMRARGSVAADVEKIREGFIEIYTVVGAGVSFVDQFDGMVIGTNAVRLADSWAKLAETDPKVRKALMRMMTGTSWGAVIVAHAMVAVPIMQHHNMIPGQREPVINADT
jgi:hypothetical protein